MLQGCQHKVVTICYTKHVTDLSEQPCNKSDNFGKVVTSCQQVVPKRLTTCDKQCVDKLVTRCEIFACVVYCLSGSRHELLT